MRASYLKQLEEKDLTKGLFLYSLLHSGQYISIESVDVSYLQLLQHMDLHTGWEHRGTS